MKGCNTVSVYLAGIGVFDKPNRLATKAEYKKYLIDEVNSFYEYFGYYRDNTDKINLAKRLLESAKRNLKNEGGLYWKRQINECELEIEVYSSVK